MLDSPDPVGAFCAERQLWGVLTGNRELETALRGAIERAQAWVATRR